MSLNSAARKGMQVLVLVFYPTFTAGNKRVMAWSGWVIAASFR